METIKSVVFDLDGTLAHSVPSLRFALNDLLMEDGLPPLSEAEVTAMVGEGANLLVTRAYEARGVGSADGTDAQQPERLKRFLVRYGRDPLTGTVLYPGAFSLLKRLSHAGIVLGVCTNKPEAPARVLIHALGIDPFITALVGGDTLGRRKPDPEPLEHTLALMKTDRNGVLYVGDSAIDVACAKAVGVPVAILEHGYGTYPASLLRADYVFADLPTLGNGLFPTL